MGTRCRVCIEKGGEWTLLNTKIQNSSNLTFFDFLNKCTSLNACESDNLPQSLCSICTHSINTFYSFVKLAEKSDTILREVLKKTIATERCNDNREFSWEEIIIRNEMVEEESEDLNKEDSFHCQRSTDATGSSFYIQDIVEEERISERPPSVAKISESDEFHPNLDHPEWYIEEPVDVLSSSCDGHLESVDTEYRDSEDDVPISLLGKKLGTIKETNSQKTKNEYENHIKIGLGCRNQVSSEAAADSLTGHTENNYKCKECDMVFNDKGEFRTHSRNHVCGDKHECNICGKKFAKLKYLRIHLPIHDENRKYKCSICGKGFNQYSCRWNHMRVHSGEKPFECKICGTKFKAKSNLKLHMESHSGITKKCGQCEKEFRNTRDLSRHMKLHINPKLFKCENCGKVFVWKHNYTRHMGICKPLANSNEEIHPKGHTENTCTECDMVFNDKEEFETKCRNHVCGDNHECDICGKKFARHQYLRNHLEIHDEEKRYKCRICGKGFKQHSTRYHHMKTHSVEKPFECEKCGTKFKAKSHLKLHMESHSGITKKCDLCDKEFKNSDTLRKHIKWHTNLKTYKCENCGKSFVWKQSYMKHMESCKPIGTSNEGTVTIEESSLHPKWSKEVIVNVTH